MKKVLVMMIVVSIIVSMLVVPAHAATAGIWDLNAAQGSINNAISQMIKNQQAGNNTVYGYTYDWSTFANQWSGWFK